MKTIVLIAVSFLAGFFFHGLLSFCLSKLKKRADSLEKERKMRRRRALTKALLVSRIRRRREVRARQKLDNTHDKQS